MHEEFFAKQIFFKKCKTKVIHSFLFQSIESWSTPAIIVVVESNPTRLQTKGRFTRSFIFINMAAKKKAKKAAKKTVKKAAKKKRA